MTRPARSQHRRRARLLAWGLAAFLALPAFADPPPGDGGGQRTVTQHDDGGRTVEVRGRSLEPRDVTTRYDSQGRVIERESVHSDGTVDRYTWNPSSGEQRQTSVAPDGATMRARTQADGSAVVVQEGYGPGRVTTETDADGNVTRTTARPDGTRRVETHGPTGPVTVTELDARGRPTRSETRDEDGTETRTEFDERGNPVKTEVRDGSGARYEETTYWPGTGVPRRTRTFHGSEVLEVLYYDEDGLLVRRSQARDHLPGSTWRWVFEDGPHGPTQRRETLRRAPEGVADEPAADRPETRTRPTVPSPRSTRPGY